MRAALRATRLLLHAVAGLFVCGLVFPWRGEGYRASYIQRWAQRLLSILAIELTVCGEPLQTGGLLASKHLSWLDIFVIDATAPVPARISWTLFCDQAAAFR